MLNVCEYTTLELSLRTIDNVIVSTPLSVTVTVYHSSFMKNPAKSEAPLV